jgi:sugar phosphate isomerase/epimerase
MKLGFNTLCLHKLSLEEVAQFASSLGFETLEIFCPSESQGRVTHIDIETLTEQACGDIKSLLQKNHLEISCLSYYTNPLAGENERDEFIRYLRKLVDAASLLDVRNISTFTGYSPQYSIEENVRFSVEVFRPVLEYAAGKNVKILIENTPMLIGGQFPGNFAYSPELWEVMFSLLPDSNFGLNYDPSHLFWLGIDYLQFTRVFSEKIFHVQAKDVEIRERKLRKTGILGDDWFEYKLPGFGDIDWMKFLTALYDSGYDDVISIENEDRNWLGQPDKTKRGLIFSKNILDRMIV